MMWERHVPQTHKGTTPTCKRKLCQLRPPIPSRRQRAPRSNLGWASVHNHGEMQVRARS